METITKKALSQKEVDWLLDVLKVRFERHKNRHESIDWNDVSKKIEEDPKKLWSLYQMEITGGEPDVIDFDEKTGRYVFFDCSPESPNERRSFCYDQEALDARVYNKPQNSAVGFAEEMGIELMTEEDYKLLQKTGNFDTKSSSWIKTPKAIRNYGEALFGDLRLNRVFIYHNNAQFHYTSRGFRGVLRV